jgi:hypothetical protein
LTQIARSPPWIRSELHVDKLGREIYMAVTLKQLEVTERLRRFSAHRLHSIQLLEAEKINKAAPLNTNFHFLLSLPGDRITCGFLARDILLPAGANICDIVLS